jgi:hypothetical protein
MLSQGYLRPTPRLRQLHVPVPLWHGRIPGFFLFSFLPLSALQGSEPGVECSAANGDGSTSCGSAQCASGLWVKPTGLAVGGLWDTVEMSLPPAAGDIAASPSLDRRLQGTRARAPQLVRMRTLKPAPQLIAGPFSAALSDLRFPASQFWTTPCGRITGGLCDDVPYIRMTPLL